MQTSLWRIAEKAAKQKNYRFRNLFGMLTVQFLISCWYFLNKKASPGVDKIGAAAYGEKLEENVEALVSAIMNKWYRAKLVLRKYIPKLNGKLRPLGIPAISDKLLQTGVKRILEAIYEQVFLACSYGYRPKRGALDAVKDLSAMLRSGGFRFIVEADIKGFFDNINHGLLLEMLKLRIDDKAFIGLIEKWLKAGILDTNGQVINPATGTPQGGIVSPILANIYLHYALDVWIEEVVKAHCGGGVYLCRYADDFVCAFRRESDAEWFYQELGKRLKEFGLELAEDKTNLIRFNQTERKADQVFEFLGFEFRWELSRYGKPVLQRRTSRKKYRASLAAFQDWAKKNCRVRKSVLFRQIRSKLQGYYNYYGIRGNSESLNDLFYQIKRILFKWINRRSQRRSYNWKGFTALLDYFKAPRPRIVHDF